jgi:hypothetical protein
MGGANALLPFLRAPGFAADLTLIGRRVVCETLGRAGLSVRSFAECGWDRATDTGEEWLKGSPIDLVLTDTLRLERDANAVTICRKLWHAARAAAIPSIAYIDTWWEPDRRFRLGGEDRPAILPDLIAVIDDMVRDELISDGYPAARVAVLGSPRFQALRSEPPPVADPTDTKRRVVFVSQPFDRLGGLGTWGLTQYSVLAALHGALIALPPALRDRLELTIALHPEDDAPAMRTFIRSWEGKAVRLGAVRLVDGAEALQAVRTADLVTGIMSIMLTEAVVIGVPVLSIQIGLTADDRLITNKMGATTPVRSTVELDARLSAALSDVRERQAMLAQQAQFAIVGDAEQRWCRAISDLLASRPFGWGSGRSGQTRDASVSLPRSAWRR